MYERRSIADNFSAKPGCDLIERESHSASEYLFFGGDQCLKNLIGNIDFGAGKHGVLYD